MPELPEVETISRSLSVKLSGLSLMRVTARRKDLRWPLPKSWRNIVGSDVVRVYRRAKYLLVDFSSGHSLILHLGMSGRIFFTDQNTELNPHDHLLFDFSAGHHLRFRDPRRFGSVHLTRTKIIFDHFLLKHLGVEPLSADFSPDYLMRQCHMSKAPIKNILMNAQRIVGVGNIYASEALFVAGISPVLPGRKLSKIQITKLVSATRQVLEESIRSGGTSLRDYVNADEKPGLHKIHLHVYDRFNQKCHRCDTCIQVVKILGRSTFFCPQCQK